MRRARFSPSESASIPAKAVTSSTSEVRKILMRRSVPMFPEPMMATFFFIAR